MSNKILATKNNFLIEEKDNDAIQIINSYDQNEHITHIDYTEREDIKNKVLKSLNKEKDNNTDSDNEDDKEEHKNDNNNLFIKWIINGNAHNNNLCSDISNVNYNAFCTAENKKIRTNFTHILL